MSEDTTNDTQNKPEQEKKTIQLIRNIPKGNRDFPVYWDEQYIMVRKDALDEKTGKLKLKLSVEVVAIEMCSRLVMALSKINRAVFTPQTWNDYIHKVITQLESYLYAESEVKEAKTKAKKKN